MLVVDKGHRGQGTETWLGERDITMVRPVHGNEKRRLGPALLRAVCRTIESVNDTFKGQLDLEQHGSRAITGVAVRVLQRVLALTATIWQNWHAGQPVIRHSSHMTISDAWNRSSSPNTADLRWCGW